MISVCMATYNGEKFLAQQLDSILIQLSDFDEVIISDDGSTDTTEAIIKRYQEKDSRIFYVKNTGKGVVENFQTAINLAKNDYIFLSDQDDIWLPNKVEVIVKYFENDPNCLLVMSDALLIDEYNNVIEGTYQSLRKCRTGFVANVIRSSYLGCAISFRRELKEKALPIPPKVPMHDMWLALIADSSRQASIIPDALIKYRRHSSNVTEINSKNNLLKQFRWRIILSYYLMKRIVFFKK